MVNGSFSRRLELALLGVIVAAGAWLRFHELGVPSLWLDEMLSDDVATSALRQPWWRWIAATFEPEHGPLFHASLLAGRMFARPETSARLIAAICGTATIPLVWIAARRLAGPATAIGASMLIAVSPLNVYYSRDGRPYALLMMLTAAVIAAFAARAGWLAFAVIGVAFAYTSGTAAPVLIAIAVCGAIAAPAGWRASIAAAGGLVLIALLYRAHSPQVAITATPDMSVPRVLQSFSIAALMPSDAWRIAYVVLALALIGAATLIWRDRANGLFLTGMAVLPAVIAWLVLVFLGHTFEIRYVTPALPAYLILAAAGAAEIGRWLRYPAWVAAAIALAISFEAMPAAREEPYRKLDWRLIASTLWNHARPGDLVIAANDWSAISLDFYLRRLPPRVRLLDAKESTHTIEVFASRAQPAWIISAGVYRANVLPGWLCRYPLLLASSVEEFGLHYSPSRAHFMQHRATAGEQRTLAGGFARSPFALTFGAVDDSFLGAGWAGPEHLGGDDMRWVNGTEASIVTPVDMRSAHTLRVRVTPFEWRGLPPQTMRVFADETDVGAATLASGWRTYEFSIAPQAWHAQGTHSVSFRFSRANVPAQLDPSSEDRRALSAMFTDLSFDAAPSRSTGAVAFAIRLQENGDHYLDDGLWRSFHSKFSPRAWNGDALSAFAARSGFDPERAVPRILSGALSIERITTSILDRGACLDNVAFARNAYWSIIGRAITEEDARNMVKPWKSARDRRRLIFGLIESSEFRERMQAHPE